jgi:anti-sigma factor RsiW
MSSHETFSEDCAAYVLGALAEDEAVALRAHMQDCAICRQEVERLSAVAAALARGVPPASAPAELRARVLEVVRAEASPPATAPATPRARRRLGGSFRRPAYGLLAAAALALGIALGALVIAPSGGPSRVIPAAVAPAERWGTARAPIASLHVSGNTGRLLVSNMPPAPRGKIYQVWVERAGRFDPTDALFNASSAGSATVAVPPSLRGASAVLVTAERLGGSSVPTMKPLITAPLG